MSSFFSDVLDVWGKVTFSMRGAVGRNAMCTEAEQECVYLYAHTHRPIFRGIIADSEIELADSISESVDSTINFTIVGRLSISNMFNISTRSADSSRPTIAVGRLQICLVGIKGKLGEDVGQPGILTGDTRVSHTSPFYFF